MKMNKKERGSILTTIVMLILGVIYLFPIILLVINSFKPYNDMIRNMLSLPTSLYLGNYLEAIEQMKFLMVFRNSLIVTAGTVVLGILVSFMAAYGISHLVGRVSTLIYMLFTLGQIIPFHSIMIALNINITNWNLNNSFAALIMLYAGFHCAFGIFTYVGFLKSIPAGLEEAATVDGCGLFRMMWSIVFPLVRSTTITIGVLFFLWTWNDFLMPSLLISDSSMKTLTVALYLFKSTASTKWNLLIAALVLSMIPIVVLYLVAQRYITSGITAGAIKA